MSIIYIFGEIDPLHEIAKNRDDSFPVGTYFLDRYLLELVIQIQIKLTSEIINK